MNDGRSQITLSPPLSRKREREPALRAARSCHNASTYRAPATARLSRMT
jgi:hypothetical protein